MVKGKGKTKKPEKITSEKFPYVICVVVLICIGIFYCMLKTMTVDRQKWIQIRKSTFEKDNDTTQAARGKILSSDGELLASSLPNYKVHFDFLACVPNDTSTPKKRHLRDSLLRKRMDTIRVSIPKIAKGLADICPALDSAGYQRHFEKGLQERNRYFDVCPGYILNYLQFSELKKLPVFNFPGKYASGLDVALRNNRKKPFGSLARRTLGEMYKTEDKGQSGLEHAYDSYLKGTPGLARKRRIRSKSVSIVDREPVDGYDLVSTIDVSMQDICESALVEKLRELDAEFGVVILMEVKTGDVKAIVNMGRDSLGRYSETLNYALSALVEPGSTFKTASIMVALDDGVITPNDKVDTGNGLCKMHGAIMRDANWGRGGCGMLDATYAMVRSSNIGVSKLIDEHYHDNPRKFIEGLKRVGIATPLGLPFYNMANPHIIGPDSKKTYWSEASLPWLSIGYGSLIPPISTVTFYNAIANNGKMVRPRFVKGIQRDGEMVKEFPVEVIKPHICKPQTLQEIREILYKVVNDKSYGTGKRARTKHFGVAGKTGTAQVAEGGNYHSGHRKHFVSFCGFYPYENPQYTCLVAIKTAAPGASGGTMAGTVFAKIAERVYSKQITTDIALACDSQAVFVPEVKSGDASIAHRLLAKMGISSVKLSNNDIPWAQAVTSPSRVEFKPLIQTASTVPDLTDMGARDAVYAIESRGMKARVRGYGHVTRQSVAPGTVVKKGRVVVIELN